MGAKTKALSQDVTIQRCILVHLNLVHMLVAVSKAVFVSMYTLLVAIRSGTSAQLANSDLLSCHGGGRAEEIAGVGEGARRDGTRQAKQVLLADRNAVAISQVAVGAVGSK